jgi:hypothetical protein
VSQGLNDNFLPVWLQGAGYDTYYVGKLFNAHTVDNYHSPYVRGFTSSVSWTIKPILFLTSVLQDFLLDPFTYQYLNSTFQRNQEKPINYAGNYSTDVLASKVYGFLDDAAAGEKPFFLVAAPNAPHSNVDWDGTGSIGDGTIKDSYFKFGAPISAERHKDLFPNEVVPRTPNFNPEQVCSITPSSSDLLTMSFSHLEEVGFAHSIVKTRQTSLTMIISIARDFGLCKQLTSLWMASSNA